MTLGCLTPTPNQIYPERMRIFPYGNSKEYLVLWKQVLNNSLDVLRKGRTSTPRKDRVTGNRCTLHLKRLEMWTKYILKTLDIRQGRRTVTPREGKQIR